MIRADWRILQLADSAFPAGGFAHSAGLEAAFACGETRTAAGLDAHVRAYLWNVGTASLPLVAAAHADPAGCEGVDAEADAFLTSHVANRASRTQGRAFVVTSAAVFETPELMRLAGRARAGSTPAHLAPMFGAALGSLGLDRRQTLALHLHGALRGIVSAAVRLGIAGPLEAQRLQLAQAGAMDAILASAEGRRAADAANVAPLLDIIGATHDRLHTRLFQS